MTCESDCGNTIYFLRTVLERTAAYFDDASTFSLRVEKCYMVLTIHMGLRPVGNYGQLAKILTAMRGLLQWMPCKKLLANQNPLPQCA